jgi:hypothetical protein
VRPVPGTRPRKRTVRDDRQHPLEHVSIFIASEDAGPGRLVEDQQLRYRAAPNSLAPARLAPDSRLQYAVDLHGETAAFSLVDSHRSETDRSINDGGPNLTDPVEGQHVGVQVDEERRW